MATTAAVVTPTPVKESVGTEIKNAFKTLGRDLEKAGAETEAFLTNVEPKIAALLPGFIATLNVLFPNLKISAATATKILATTVNTAGVVANALNAEGANATLDETAAATIAGLIHGTGASAVAAVAAANTPTA